MICTVCYLMTLTGKNQDIYQQYSDSSWTDWVTTRLVVLKRSSSIRLTFSMKKSCELAFCSTKVTTLSHSLLFCTPRTRMPHANCSGMPNYSSNYEMARVVILFILRVAKRLSITLQSLVCTELFPSHTSRHTRQMKRKRRVGMAMGKKSTCPWVSRASPVRRCPSANSFTFLVSYLPARVRQSLRARFILMSQNSTRHWASMRRRDSVEKQKHTCQKCQGLRMALVETLFSFQRGPLLRQQPILYTPEYTITHHIIIRPI